jgi:hypothetical protein
MKYFFLVGSQAVSDYPDLDFIDYMGGDVIMFDTETMTPPQLMEMADGWHDFLVITEDEYTRIYNLLYPESK